MLEAKVSTVSLIKDVASKPTSGAVPSGISELEGGVEVERDRNAKGAPTRFAREFCWICIQQIRHS